MIRINFVYAVNGTEFNVNVEETSAESANSEIRKLVGLTLNTQAASVTPAMQEDARASTGLAETAAPPKKGPGRPTKAEADAKAQAEAAAAALAKKTTPVDEAAPKVEYLTSGLPERIATLAADAGVKPKLITLIREFGGIVPPGVEGAGKTLAKHIPADKLAAFADELAKLEPQAEEDDGAIG